MKALDVADIIKVIDGDLRTVNNNFLIRNAVRRSRELKENTLYFHLYKNRKLNWTQLNNHKTIVIVTEDASVFERIKEAVPIVQVKNIQEAYWNFVEYYRGLFEIPIIGITGTCGKSTTKEMIKHILSAQLNVRATYKSNNGPSTNFRYLMQIDDHTQAAVIEMAVINPGDVAKSCRHFKPQIRVLLNIGTYHLVGCKTPENYIKAKAEILTDIDPINDVLIVNEDDENIKKIDLSDCKRVISFGYQDHCHWQAKKVKSDENGTSFFLTYDNHDYKVFVPGLGQHNVYNALAALAAVKEVGVDLEDAIERLQTFTHLEKHLEVREGPNRCTIIDDNWNNTPPSMEAALRSLSALAGKKHKIAVLGYMYNLGTSKYAREQYAQLGKIVAEVGVDTLVVIGDKPIEIGKKAIESGMDEKKVYFIKRGAEVPQLLAPLLNKNTVVLLKAPEDGVTL